MNDIIAIDILILPDAHAIHIARLLNDRLNKNFPPGYKFDDRHVPHITMLQRYIRISNLQNVFTAIEDLIKSAEAMELSFIAKGIRHADGWNAPGIGYASIVLEPSPRVINFQDLLITKTQKHFEIDGNIGSFIASNDGSMINKTTTEWVKNFVPNQMGVNFKPHISSGFAEDEYLESIEKEHFEEFSINAAGVGIFHLGNYGVASKELYRSVLAVKKKTDR